MPILSPFFSGPLAKAPLLAALMLLVPACDNASAPQAQPDAASTPAGAPNMEVPGEISRMHAGEAIPNIAVTDPSGAKLDLANIGEPVLLNLWATWCAPCVVEMPLLDDLAGTLQDEVRVVTVSQDLRGAERVEPFFAERDFTHLEPWLDPQADLSAQFSQSGLLPTTILFDAQGREIWRVAGDYDWDSEEAIAAIREGLAASTS